MENEEVLDDNQEEKNEEQENSNEELEKLRKENETLKAQKAHWKEKAEKPKEEEKEEKKEEEPKLSLKDLRALGDIKHDEDVDVIVDWAKARNISIAEAKADDDLQAILKNREEKRRSAEVANTGGGKRSDNKVSGESILDKVRRGGDLPESDEDMQKMFAAKYKKA